MTKELILIYVTVPDKKAGTVIMKHLLEKKLIACGNLFPEVTSCFRWEGKIQMEKEFIMILKTHKRFYKQVEDEITKIHPYECPCILSLPVKEVYAPFLSWIENSCSK